MCRPVWECATEHQKKVQANKSETRPLKTVDFTSCSKAFHFQIYASRLFSEPKLGRWPSHALMLIHVDINLNQSGTLKLNKFYTHPKTQPHTTNCNFRTNPPFRSTVSAEALLACRYSKWFGTRRWWDPRWCRPKDRKMTNRKTEKRRINMNNVLVMSLFMFFLIETKGRYSYY